MKGYHLNTIISIIAVVPFSACYDAPHQQPGQTQVAEKYDTTPAQTEHVNTDALFLENSASFNMEQLRLSRLAQLNTTNENVKALGLMLETSHTKSNASLSELAKSKMVVIPSAPGNEEEYKKFTLLNGGDFDKAYCDMVVLKYSTAIAEFDEGVVNAKDPEIKNWAAITRSVLQTHHQCDSCLYFFPLGLL